MFSAPSPLPTAPGVLCLSLSALHLFLPFPLNFLPWDGGWGLKLSQGIAHTGRPMTGRDSVALVDAEETRKTRSRLRPALSFPLNFLPWDGGWGLKLFLGELHTQAAG